MGQSLRIFFLVLAALWYGVVLPGHQRGIVKLPGPATDSCCSSGNAATSDTACHDQPDDDDNSTPRDLGSNCAICQLVSVTPVPVTIHFDPLPLQELRDITAPPYHAPQLQQRVTSTPARAPPMTRLSLHFV